AGDGGTDQCLGVGAGAVHAHVLGEALVPEVAGAAIGRRLHGAAARRVAGRRLALACRGGTGHLAATAADAEVACGVQCADVAVVAGRTVVSGAFHATRRRVTRHGLARAWRRLALRGGLARPRPGVAGAGETG